MLPTVSVVRLGTRGSALARWQTDYVQRLLRQAWPTLQTDVQTMTTHGVQVLDTPLPMVGGKGLFTAEFEAALHGRTIDLAVHSLKDLPTDRSEGLVDRQVDGVTFTSSSTVNHFLRRLESEGGTLDYLNGVCLACMGPITLQTAREHGLHIEVMSVCHTLAGLVAELEAYFTV